MARLLVPSAMARRRLKSHKNISFCIVYMACGVFVEGGEMVFIQKEANVQRNVRWPGFSRGGRRNENINGAVGIDRGGGGRPVAIVYEEWHF